jgi:pescadillo protein
MLTFLEFYEIFFKYVLFKLYNMIGQTYPPMIDSVLNESGSHIMSVKPSGSVSNLVSNTTAATASAEDDNEKAITTIVTDNDSTSKISTNNSKLSKQQKILSKKQLLTLEQKLSSLSNHNEEEDENEDNNDHDEEDENVDLDRLNNVFADLHNNDIDETEDEKQIFGSKSNNNSNNDGDKESDNVHSNLFKGLRFYINREVPLEVMQLCILSCNGMVGWEGSNSPYDMTSGVITHHIIDRPLLEEHKNLPGREYVQPQWIFDSINSQMLLPCHKYAVGVKLPPHLSPFVDDNKSGYTPSYKTELHQISSNNNNGVSNDDSKMDEDVDEDGDESSEEEDNYEEEIRAEKMGKSYSQNKNKHSKQNEPSDSEDEEEDGNEDESEEEGDNDNIDEDVPLSNRKGPKAIVYDPNTSSGKNKRDKVFYCSTTFLHLSCV